MLLAGLIVISLALTCTMFATRQAMLGFACAMFWAMTGAQSYTLSLVPWGDLYFYLGFAAGFGMTAFTSLAAFGLREKRDTLADEEMDETDSTGEGDGFIDEEGKIDGTTPQSGKKTQLSGRIAALRERASRRRSGTKSAGRKRTSWEDGLE